MKIIDAHTHLGGSRTTGFVITKEDWIEAIETHHLDGIITLPFPEPYPDSYTMHNEIAALAKDPDFPCKVWGIADMNPRHDEDEYRKEITRAIRELGFVAIKLHPYLESTKPQDRHAVKVYETARELNVPVVVHTGMGVPLALPSQMIPVAQRYPDLKFVLAHSGSTFYFDEALLAAQMCDNIYLELSTCYTFQVAAAMGKIGSSKLMFGSDGPLNVGVEIASVTEPLLRLSETDQERILSGTAIEVYKLK